MRLPGAALLVALAASLGCSDGVTPEVRDLRFIGQAPDAPLVIITEVEFFDPDGDLGEGFIESFVNNKPSGLGQMDLLPFFLFEEHDLRLTVGTFRYQLELNLGPEVGEVAVFDLGVRLTDVAGHVSPTKTVRLRLER